MTLFTVKQLFFILTFLVSTAAFSQFENKKSPLKFSAKLPPSVAVKSKEEIKFEFKKPPTYSSAFPDPKMPLPRAGGGIIKNKFVDPNDGIVDRLNRAEGSPMDGFKSDRFFGDFRSNGKVVRIVCRDFGEVDGDRVRVYNNDKVVEYEIFLNGSFQEVNVELHPGFNKIEFQALNMGTSGPNTAEFQMYDDKGKLLVSNQWNLTTGVKASLIVVKE
jgi:hypothetical protein